MSELVKDCLGEGGADQKAAARGGRWLIPRLMSGTLGFLAKWLINAPME